MTTVVLGATGLVGRYIVEALAHTTCDNVIATFHRRPAYEAPRTTWVQCDLSQPGTVNSVLSNASCAILCAGRLATSSTLKFDPVSPIVDTLRVATNVLEAAAIARLRTLVLVSSCTVYPTMLRRPALESDALVGTPPDPWYGVGWMHRYIEEQLRWYVEHVGWIGAAIVLRPTMVYGRYGDFSSQTGHFLPSFVAKVVERKRPIEVWGDGQQTRNLIHATDLARAVLMARAATLPAFSNFNVTSPRDTSVNEVLRELIDIERFSDAEIKYNFAQVSAPATLKVNGDKFRKETGWETIVTLREGLADTVEWYRHNARTAVLAPSKENHRD